MECPICKKGRMLAYRGQEKDRGVTFEVVGKKCEACSETLFEADEVARQERALAYGLVALGLRTGRDFQYVRKIAGLRGTELAALLDVRAETVSRWERGEIDIPRTAAFVLGELLDRPRVTRAKLEAYQREIVPREVR